jgi:hypothetical protein
MGRRFSVPLLYGRGYLPDQQGHQDKVQEMQIPEVGFTLRNIIFFMFCISDV